MLLLGYGLVGIPRTLWRAADIETCLKRCLHRCTTLHAHSLQL